MSAAREFTARLGSLASTATAVQQHLGLLRGETRERRIRFLDTFDWRVDRAGWRLTAGDDTVELTDRDSGAVLLRTAGTAEGACAADLPPALRAKLGPVLGLRALLPVATLTLAELVLVARNTDDKIVARLVVSAAVPDGRARPVRGAPVRIAVVPLRGYDKEGRRLGDELSALEGVAPAATTLFADAVAAAGRQVGDYSGKLALALDPRRPAAEQVRVVYRALLDTMRANEAGVAAAWDTEFLHDYRVAVRRTRSALKELRAVLADRDEARFRQAFKWLGDITTPTRDLDVYLLGFAAIEQAAGAVDGELAPLHDLLVADRRRAHTDLARALQSARYARLLREWTTLVAADAAGTPAAGAAAAVPIGDLADERLRKVGRRVLRDGTAIDPDTPAEALHDLRKRCKELRYLIEFFGGFYDPDAVRGLLGALKALQDNLGAFQDGVVQHAAVDGFAERLLADRSAPAATLLALGRLGAVLEDRQHSARREFADRFAAFAAPANRRRLDALTGAAA